STDLERRERQHEVVRDRRPDREPDELCQHGLLRGEFAGDQHLDVVAGEPDDAPRAAELAVAGDAVSQALEGERAPVLGTYEEPVELARVAEMLSLEAGVEILRMEVPADEPSGRESRLTAPARRDQ